jgi:autophagy-related protein 9
MPRSPQGNSLLNLLNPYGSASRPADPDSPSNGLLRELQGGEDEDSPEPLQSIRGRDSGDHEEGDRTPKSPPTVLPYRPNSPGPFALPSSSTSSRTQSTSPSRSAYADTDDAIGSNITTNAKDESAASTPPPPPPRTATFREPPRTVEPIASGSRPQLVARDSGSGRTAGFGYNDPVMTESGSKRSKGKGRARRKVVDERTVDLGDDQRQRKKEGLNEYEKALWKWVNVDDLDGFLQEVRRLSGAIG